MATKFVLRTDKTEGYATLYARIQSRAHKINIRVSTGLEVDVKEWVKEYCTTQDLSMMQLNNKQSLNIGEVNYVCRKKGRHSARQFPFLRGQRYRLYTR